MPSTVNVGITGIDATYYLTKDLRQATAFYAGLFGRGPDMYVENTVAEWTFAGGESFGLYQPQDSKEWHSSSGVLFHVANLQDSREAARGAGAMFDDHLEDTPMCYMAFGRDPEGNRFILHQPK
jgi:predicted enzyme related to lactoylglutathione lyase